MPATVVTPPQVVTQPPTRIVADAADTATLVSTYLTPLIAGLNITPPTGFQAVGLNFRILPNGSSQAFVTWAVIPTPTPSS